MTPLSKQQVYFLNVLGKEVSEFSRPVGPEEKNEYYNNHLKTIPHLPQKRTSPLVLPHVRL